MRTRDFDLIRTDKLSHSFIHSTNVYLSKHGVPGPWDISLNETKVLAFVENVF